MCKLNYVGVIWLQLFNLHMNTGVCVCILNIPKYILGERHWGNKVIVSATVDRLYGLCYSNFITIIVAYSFDEIVYHLVSFKQPV